MELYLIIISAYSFYHFLLFEMQNINKWDRPMFLSGRPDNHDYKINRYHFSVGVPVFILFVISLIIFDTIKIVIYTIIIRVVGFLISGLIVPILNNLFPRTKEMLIGNLIFLFKWLILLGVLVLFINYLIL